MSFDGYIGTPARLKPVVAPFAETHCALSVAAGQIRVLDGYFLGNSVTTDALIKAPERCTQFLSELMRPPVMVIGAGGVVSTAGATVKLHNTFVASALQVNCMLYMLAFPYVAENGQRHMRWLPVADTSEFLRMGYPHVALPNGMETHMSFPFARVLETTPCVYSHSTSQLGAWERYQNVLQTSSTISNHPTVSVELL